MVPIWVAVIVGLVMFWFGYIVCGLLLAAEQATREAEDSDREK